MDAEKYGQLALNEDSLELMNRTSCHAQSLHMIMPQVDHDEDTWSSRMEMVAQY